MRGEVWRIHHIGEQDELIDTLKHFRVLSFAPVNARADPTRWRVLSRQTEQRYWKITLSLFAMGIKDEY